MQYESVIGLEVHVRLQTNSKLFSGAANAYGALPNHQACAIDLGYPGVLPVVNEQAINMAIKLGLAINATIAKHTVFARKNYFYPDLPKGYQISQLDLPIVHDGYLDIELEDQRTKRITIARAHLEEDAGKSTHLALQNLTGVDLNRAGTPLIEIVTTPVIENAKQAVAYLKKLHSLVRYLEICDGNMQEGSFRCDANVSIRPTGEKKLGTRTEIKNVNSFRFIEKAIDYEIARQIDIIESGGKVVQETRLYDADLNQTRSMRSKEEANDYRYFPDPDLLPIIVEQTQIDAIRKTLPELPTAKYQRFITQYQLSEYDADCLIADQKIAAYFEDVAKQCSANAKIVANWIIGDLSAALNKHELTIAQSPITAENLAQLLNKIADNTISGKIAKNIFEKLWQGEKDVTAIIAAQGLTQISDTTQLNTIIDEILNNNLQQVTQYREGNEKLLGYFVGQIMKASKGKANPQIVNELLLEKLAKK